MPAPPRTTVPPSLTLAKLRELSAPLLPLPALAPAPYVVGHAAFEERSTQRALLTSWLCERLALRTGPISVLSVGCGDGIVDEDVARALAQDGRQVGYAGLDPHPPSAGSFLRRLGAVPAVAASAAVGLIDALPQQPTYDAALAVHCLYYVPDLAASVRRLRSLLRPGGELIVLLAPRSGLNDLASLLAPPADGRYQWWADDLAGVLGDGVERHQVLGRLDLTDAGDEVIDFLVQAELPQALRDPVQAHLQSLSADDELVLDHVVDAFVVPAPVPAPPLAPAPDLA